jgi:hypothetical protein
MDTRSNDLVMNAALIEGLKQAAHAVIAEAAPCPHKRVGMYPFCTLCGQLLEELSDLQDWTCEHCLVTNSGFRVICTFCCKTNQDQKEKVRKERERERESEMKRKLAAA